MKKLLVILSILIVVTVVYYFYTSKKTPSQENKALGVAKITATGNSSNGAVIVQSRKDSEVKRTYAILQGITPRYTSSKNAFDSANRSLTSIVNAGQGKDGSSAVYSNQAAIDSAQALLLKTRAAFDLVQIEYSIAKANYDKALEDYRDFANTASGGTIVFEGQGRG
jgi:hypothetical protein